MKTVCCVLVLALFVASTFATHHQSEDDDTVSGQTFRQWHDIFTWGGPQKWTEEHLTKLNRMCEMVTSDEPQPWNSDRNQERQRSTNDMFNFNNEESFRQHLQDVKRCCKKTSTFDKKLCFKAMREDFLDVYCDQGANHVCCRREMAQRYTCFGKKLDRSLTPEELDLDDVPPLPSGIKIRLGPALPQDDSIDDVDSEDDDAAITNLLEQFDAEADDNNGQCMADFFPENEINSMTNSVANEVCTEACAASDKKCEAKACCRVGAYVGRKYVKKGCPYLQCRRIFKIFAKKHKQCIKNRKICGFFFISCCQRQHHKDMYLQIAQSEGQQEVEMFNEMPAQNRAKKNGNTVREQANLRWE
jgi:hypothetical protein